MGLNEKELKEQVRKILLSNVVEGHSKILKKNFCYIQPSKSKYHFQFWWDTCFHIFMLCDLEEYEIAKKNLTSLFAMQEENGFVGHMIFWQKVFPTTKSDILQARPTFRQFRPHMSALIQPPLIAQALLRIYEGEGDKEFMQKCWSKLKTIINGWRKTVTLKVTG